MPRILRSPVEGSATAERALTILRAFRSAEGMSLARLAQESGLYKSTTLRLLQSLVAQRFLLRMEDGLYRIGPEMARLGTFYDRENDERRKTMHVLQQLVEATRETAALHVVENGYRLRRYWLESPLPLREHVDEQERLPLHRGAGGLILRAWTQRQAAGAAALRKQGYAVSRDGRIEGLSGISAPVFGPNGNLTGALTLTMPSTRYRTRWIGLLVKRAAELTSALGGAPT